MCLLLFSVLAVTLISPIELVRTKMQSEQLSYQQIGIAVKNTVHQGGLIALMRGLGPTMLRDVPFSGYQLYLVTGVSYNYKPLKMITIWPI